MFQDRSPPGDAFPFRVLQFRSGPHENFHYVIGPQAGEAGEADETGEASADPRRAVWVDPAFHLDRLEAATRAAGLAPRWALFTHAHWDHIGGLPDVLDHGVTDIGIHAAAAEHEKVLEARQAGATVHLLGDDDALEPAGVPMQVLHTPGHQPEAVCYLFGQAGARRALMTGDTLFVGSCGRTDFPGGDTDAMFASMARLRDLEGDVMVFPGHDYADAPRCGLGEEKVSNPALAIHEREAFGRLPFLWG